MVDFISSFIWIPLASAKHLISKLFQHIDFSVSDVLEDWESINQFDFTQVPENGMMNISWVSGEHRDEREFSEPMIEEDDLELAHAFVPGSVKFNSTDGDIHLNANHIWCAEARNCGNY